MMELLLASDTRALIQDLLVYGLTIVAIFWGAAPERAAIAVWWVCIELPEVVFIEMLGYDVRFVGIDPYLAFKDIAAGVLWIALALYANRNFTLWIAGMQLVAVGSHVAKGLVEAISPISYVFLVVVPGWMQLLIMAIGFTRHILRVRKHGKYRDWRIVGKAGNFDGLGTAGPSLASSGARSGFRKGMDE